MILGTLSLQQKRGVFYSEVQVESEDQFSAIENRELNEVFIHPTDDTHKTFMIIPVEEPGNTDYITATFEDDGKAQYPYEVTVWLLIEESNLAHNGHLK